MPWMRFTAPFDFSPKAMGGLVTIAYPAGMARNVTRECFAAALLAGKGKPCQRPAKETANAGRG